MCVILPFARQRFTPTDLLAWGNIAVDRQRRGLWQNVSRVTAPEHDRLLVWLPGKQNPTLLLERDVLGLYRLSYHDGNGWYQFRQGPSIIDCLAHMDPDEAPQRKGAGSRSGK
ncbi:hypothetical protein [Niveispirillum fermenti]|uniref:hypothetical protein n=1 Tax=Niveispirillum fermenti TaxID=1233113 RepID=UPI003A882ACA